MLKLTPASVPRPADRRPIIGLAIAGGGPLGAIYELGALQAIDEAIDGVHMHDLDVYVGVSSGSFLTASLANRITATQMGRIFMSADDAEFQFQPEMFLRPALKEYLSRAKAVPSVIFDLIREAIRHPSRLAHLESLEGIARLVPTGLFDNHMIEHFLKGVLSRQGRSNDFRKLTAKLRVVAVELDSGQAVRFGEPGLDHVPISSAVQASAALPGLYPPVEIDGRFYVDGALRRTLHASVALKEGADLLIGINPLVPYDGDGVPRNGHAHSRMVQGGLPAVLSQTFRALIQSRMQVGMSKYEKEYPAVGMMLVEPNRNDEQMFFTNIFSYASRNELVDHAYQTTRKELLARADELEPFLETYDLGLNRSVLETPRSFHEAMREDAPYLAPVGNDLARTLDSLERLLRR
ncbi:patatin-like phospholipase family protein [Wenzhouxiangella marina]|uniref:Lectin subunit Beta n=1 Tax=Wenzhouxiangella marina TaxID=1579979 RepID=A0A0K0XWW4_9GAMM|nr:patatin-like phospholipase family protein [Wenzhouxiangella marina]AKS42160.1 lectin subunit Beta [Wenzhouxiangella marina]MBB6086068.1 putative acylesterase/phospholipase RssA [Wenzhouxiangella marina]